MKRSFFVRLGATIALFAITSTSIAIADPPIIPLAVWSAIKEPVELELICDNKSYKGTLLPNTMVKYYNQGKCRLIGIVRTSAGPVAIPGRDFTLGLSKTTSTYVDRDADGKFVFK